MEDAMSPPEVIENISSDEPPDYLIWRCASFRPDEHHGMAPLS
jgi:hypothetical protein